MDLIKYLRAGNWPVAAGYALFVGMMAIGYFYNVTFVQLGLVDLGQRVLGLSRQAVAGHMALLALLTGGTALAAGLWFTRLGGLTLLAKLRLALAVVGVQTVLTAAAPFVSGEGSFRLWLIICSLTLGVGVPATFSLTVDLIPVRDRGLVAGGITAAAYFLAAVFSGSWQIAPLSQLLLAVMLPGLLVLAAIVLLAGAGRTFVAGWVAELSTNRTRPRFAHGRFIGRDGAGRLDGRFWVFVALMFGIFFVDSLGFLRIIDTPTLVEGAWQASRPAPRLTIGIVHVVTALLGGILYTRLGERTLFFWIFGLFALTHLTYTFRVWLLPETTNFSLGAPLLYATAVSLYTVLNFALWADFSTPRTLPRNAAVGVALSGWLATFMSTALAIQWQSSGMPLEEHLRLVNALAQLFFVGLLAAVLWPRRRRGAANS